MYKLIIPALLTASLVGCGSDSGSKAPDAPQKNPNPEVMEQAVPQLTAQKEPALRENKVPTPIYGNKIPNKVDDQGLIAPPDYNGATPGRAQLKDPNAQITPPTYIGDAPGLAQMKPEFQRAYHEKLANQKANKSMHAAQNKANRQAIENYVSEATKLQAQVDEFEKQQAESTAFADSEQDRLDQQAAAEDDARAQELLEVEQQKMADAAVENGEAVRQANGKLLPMIAPEESKGDNPGEAQFVAELVAAPTGTNPNEQQATLLDGTILYFDLETSKRLDISLQQVSAEQYKGSASLKLNGASLDISKFVVISSDENVDFNILPEDLAELSQDANSQLIKLNDLVGDDGILRLVIGSHTINLRVEETIA